MPWLKRHGLSTGFIVCVLAIGFPLWLMPYSDINIPSALYGPGLVLVFALAALLRAAGVASFLKTLNVMAATPAAAIVVRVIVDTAADPTKHNLWPLVVMIAIVIGYACAAPGAVLGHLIHRLLQHRSENAGP